MNPTRCWFPGLLALVLVGCRAAPAGGPPPAETRAIQETLDALYVAFCFDAGGEADWDAMRALFAEGAAFVAPFGEDETPRAVGEERFVEDFREFIRGSPLRETGFHERITHARVDVFGGVAHAYVVFEGFVPGEPASRRGLDSIQLVRAGERWLVASFTTQYEGEGNALPERFLR